MYRQRLFILFAALVLGLGVSTSAGQSAALQDVNREIRNTSLGFPIEVLSRVGYLKSPRIISAAALSANGPIAFISARDGNAEVYVMNPDGSGQTRLTTTAAAEYDPAVSADGTRIVFRSGRDGNDEIYVMDIDGGNQTRLTFNDAVDMMPTWSPDGTRIAFVTERDEGNREIYVMAANGDDQTNLTESAGHEGNPDWDPDDVYIAYDRNDSGYVGVYFMNTDGSDQGVFYGGVPGPGYVLAEQPAFSPDGSKIAFVRYIDGNQEVSTINLDGSGINNLSHNAANDWQPDWSPDGEQVVFASSRDGKVAVYTMNSFNGADQTIRAGSGFDYQPAWAPDAADLDADGVPADVEDGAPNGGDGNDDGIPDSLQPQVASLPNFQDDRYVTLVAPDGTALSDVAAVGNPSPANAPAVDFPIGFFDFKLALPVHEGGLAVDLFVEGGAPTFAYYKYGHEPGQPFDHWYAFAYNGQTGVETLADRLRLHFIDGDRGDNDVDANGVIVDPFAAGECREVRTALINGVANGNSSAQTGQPVVLSASVGNPDNPTNTQANPVVYQWLTTENLVSGGNTNQATYQWATAGMYTVRHKITNCSGDGSATVNHTVTVTAACAPLTGVSIDGPLSGAPGQQVVLTANPTPGGATAPTYTWSNNSSTGNQATYTLPASGALNVTVSAGNSCTAPPKTDAHTVTVVQPCQAIDSVAIAGPTSGAPGQQVTLTATVTPADATTPAFTWSNNPSTSNQATYTLPASGALSVTVSASNNCTAPPKTGSHAVSVVPTTPRVRVFDEDSQPVVGATIYRNGAVAGQTNATGALEIPGLAVGDRLIARKRVHEAANGGEGYDGWEYRVYVTSLDIPLSGEPAPFVVSDPAGATLTVKRTNVLIGLHLVVTVEWDATAAYLEDLRRGFLAAGPLLYDATDGQLVLEEVSIYDNSRYAAFSTTDTLLNASRNGSVFYRGLVRIDPFTPAYGAGFAWMSRAPGGAASNLPLWTTPAGVAELAQVVARVAFELLPSNYYYNANGLPVYDLHCLGPHIATNGAPDLNASLMASTAYATEFSDENLPALWSATCRNTRQWQQFNRSDWEAIRTVFTDYDGSVDWIIRTPGDRQGVTPGPHALPVAGWASAAVEMDDKTGVCAESPTYDVTFLGQPADAGVVLEKLNGAQLYQGRADEQGNITILGARPGERLSFLGESNPAPNQPPRRGAAILPIGCDPETRSANDAPVSVELEEVAFVLDVSVAPGADRKVLVTVAAEAALNGPPSVKLTQTGAATATTVTMSAAGGGTYTGQATLDADLPPTGVVSAEGESGSVTVPAATTFDLTPVIADQPTTAQSADGLAELFLPAGALSGDGGVTIGLVASPSPPPAERTTFSGPYNVAGQSGLSLDQATLTLHHDPRAPLDASSARLYRWNGSAWLVLSGTQSLASVSAVIDDFGVYALFARSEYELYTPVIRKN